MEKKKINYGVIGTGHIGKYHIQQIQNIDWVNLVGVFDIDQLAAITTENEFNTLAFKKLEDLLSQCDAVSIATPAFSHYDIGKLALNNMCHIFIEKPITVSVDTARELINIAENNNLLIQVGHIERFNPALIDFINNHEQCNPSFIEAHRLSPFNVRGTDTDVILDLMIHDIDLILYLIKSSIVSIEASGVSILSESLDLVNARITFKNKAVANLTASRISDKPLRKLRLFEMNQYVSIDLQKHQYSQYQVQKDSGALHSNSIFELDNKLVTLKNHQAKKTNALYEELLSFVNSIQNSQKIAVSGNDGMKAIEVALLIQQKINE
tara:strand:- start:1563 stop:2534 length:972 start_codon:yes stop_codon:yes gene_type:complete